eukprot:TRINITY_DN22395_c0_g1_i1.p1 TRINITY_DN22395_c0_g1~~TRINITY_DN22395_c0_g1_i1.p1  ORF type:complete len:166 (-),score=34.21 TRINITY_DN22395_c0_g1_i1:63-560(-)
MDRDWRCQKYGPLGWMETLVRAIAVGVGLASLSVYNSDTQVLSSYRLAQIVLMAILGGIYVALIVQRVLDKEIFALGFSVFMAVGHWVMTIVTILSLPAKLGPFLFTYALLQALAEYIKIMFLLLAENPEVRFFNKPILLAMCGFFIIIYLVVIIMQVIVWLVLY